MNLLYEPENKDGHHVASAVACAVDVIGRDASRRERPLVHLRSLKDFAMVDPSTPDTHLHLSNVASAVYLGPNLLHARIRNGRVGSPDCAHLVQKRQNQRGMRKRERIETESNIYRLTFCLLRLHALFETRKKFHHRKNSSTAD